MVPWEIWALCVRTEFSTVLLEVRLVSWMCPLSGEQTHRAGEENKTASQLQFQEQVHSGTV